MEISKKTWNNYIGLLRKINDKAVQELTLWIKYNGGDALLDPNVRDANGRNIIDASYLIAQKYGNASASVSAQMCEAMAELSKKINPADLADLPEYSEVAKTVNGVLKTSKNSEELTSAVGRLVKRTGMRTTLKMASDSGAEYAWIPSGDTCAFCIALASRGWQKAGNVEPVEHLHSNCDCTYAIRYNKNTQIAGYDPDEYKEQWDEAYEEEGNAKDALNYMRRQYYQRNKDEILAQKASAEEKREELNSSQAEETKVQ